jgi:hypothetical protein
MRGQLQIIVFLALVAVGCADEPAATPAPTHTSGSEGHVEADRRTTEPAPTPVEDAPSGNACLRAFDCCVAFVDALASLTPEEPLAMTPESVCAGVREAAEAGAAAEPTCKGATDNWRVALGGMGLPIPDSCR